MRIIETKAEIDGIKRGCVLAIGNFDGVHIGHQEILAAAREIANQRDAELAAMTFEYAENRTIPAILVARAIPGSLRGKIKRASRAAFRPSVHKAILKGVIRSPLEKKNAFKILLEAKKKRPRA